MNRKQDCGFNKRLRRQKIGFGENGGLTLGAMTSARQDVLVLLFECYDRAVDLMDTGNNREWKPWVRAEKECYLMR